MSLEKEQCRETQRFLEIKLVQKGLIERAAAYLEGKVTITNFALNASSVLQV